MDQIPSGIKCLYQLLIEITDQKYHDSATDRLRARSLQTRDMSSLSKIRMLAERMLTDPEIKDANIIELSEQKYRSDDADLQFFAFVCNFIVMNGQKLEYRMERDMDKYLSEDNYNNKILSKYRLCDITTDDCLLFKRSTHDHSHHENFNVMVRILREVKYMSTKYRSSHSGQFKDNTKSSERELAKKHKHVHSLFSSLNQWLCDQMTRTRARMIIPSIGNPCTIGADGKQGHSQLDPSSSIENIRNRFDKIRIEEWTPNPEEVRGYATRSLFDTICGFHMVCNEVINEENLEPGDLRTFIQSSRSTNAREQTNIETDIATLVEHNSPVSRAHPDTFGEFQSVVKTSIAYTILKIAREVHHLSTFLIDQQSNTMETISGHLKIIQDRDTHISNDAIQEMRVVKRNAHAISRAFEEAISCTQSIAESLLSVSLHIDPDIESREDEFASNRIDVWIIEYLPAFIRMCEIDYQKITFDLIETYLARAELQSVDTIEEANRMVRQTITRSAIDVNDINIQSSDEEEEEKQQETKRQTRSSRRRSQRTKKNTVTDDEILKAIDDIQDDKGDGDEMDEERFMTLLAKFESDDIDDVTLDDHDMDTKQEQPGNYDSEDEEEDDIGDIDDMLNPMQTPQQGSEQVHIDQDVFRDLVEELKRMNNIPEYDQNVMEQLAGHCTKYIDWVFSNLNVTGADILGEYRTVICQCRDQLERAQQLILDIKAVADLSIVDVTTEVALCENRTDMSKIIIGRILDQTENITSKTSVIPATWVTSFTPIIRKFKQAKGPLPPIRFKDAVQVSVQEWIDSHVM